MENVYLFTGDNRFALLEKAKAWKDQFEKKHGAENLLVLDADKLRMRELLDEVSVAPFIAEKRLVMVRGVPKMTKDEVQSIDHVKHSDIVLVFVESKLDKRLGGTKELLSSATVEESKYLSPSALRSWVKGIINDHGSSIDAHALDRLIEMVGEDQSFLYQEACKLALYRHGESITVDDIDTLVLCSVEKEVWALMDLIGQRKKNEALAYIGKLLQQGDSAHGLWAILLWMLSSLAPVTHAVREGITNPGALAKRCGVSYGSARALVPVAKTMTDERLRLIVDKAAQGDRDLKTGVVKATTDEPQELETLIETTVLACMS